MPNLYDKESGRLLGPISDRDLDFLIRQLEEEGIEDQDYYIEPATLEWFEDHGAEPSLVEMLRRALGDREGMEIAWREA
ncbi:MAG TPA: galactosyldiacylglycerol synthase [Anaerolineae bacterium]|nr:galactosyldiacylglycerol synthase [Anaerolineae bacterium]